MAWSGEKIQSSTGVDAQGFGLLSEGRGSVGRVWAPVPRWTEASNNGAELAYSNSFGRS